MSKTKEPLQPLQKPLNFTTWKEMANYYLDALKRERDEKLFYKHSYETEHEQYIAQNTMFRQLQSEFNSKFQETKEIQEVAFAEEESDERASKNITDIVRGNKPNLWRLTWAIVSLVLGGFLIWQLAVNVEFRAAVLNPVVIMLVVIAIVFAYLILRKLRKR